VESNRNVKDFPLTQVSPYGKKGEKKKFDQNPFINNFITNLDIIKLNTSQSRIIYGNSSSFTNNNSGFNNFCILDKDLYKNISKMIKKLVDGKNDDDV